LIWEHNYWPEYAEITPEPASSDHLTRLAEIADDAARRISRAISAAAIPVSTQAIGQESHEQ
jgi:hypothetical protein